MSKSLAERIGEHTHKVIAEREDKKRAENKEKVLDALTNDFKTKANKGLTIFCSEEKSELDFDLYAIDGMNAQDVVFALRDIGFEIHSYPMRKVAAIPQQNVSDVILNLVDMYNTILIRFERSETKKAQQDIETVMKMLEQEQYEVLNINHVRVSISSQSETQYYLECITKILHEINLCVDYVTNDFWDISIQEESD